jgi:hypothetical protein
LHASSMFFATAVLNSSPTGLWSRKYSIKCHHLPSHKRHRHLKVHNTLSQTKRIKVLYGHPCENE